VLPMVCRMVSAFIANSEKSEETWKI